MKAFLWGLVYIYGIAVTMIMAGSMGVGRQAGRHGAGEVVMGLTSYPTGREGDTGLAWAFETPKFTPSDTPPTRLHSILLKQFHSLVTKHVCI